MPGIFITWNYGHGGNGPLAEALTAAGLPKCSWVGDGVLNNGFDGNFSNPPVQAAVERVARVAAGERVPLWFDLENDSVLTDPHQSPANLATRARMIGWAGAVDPALRLGDYFQPDPSVPADQRGPEWAALNAELTDAVTQAYTFAGEDFATWRARCDSWEALIAAQAPHLRRVAVLCPAYQTRDGSPPHNTPADAADFARKVADRLAAGYDVYVWERALTDLPAYAAHLAPLPAMAGIGVPPEVSALARELADPRYAGLDAHAKADALNARDRSRPRMIPFAEFQRTLLQMPCWPKIRLAAVKADTPDQVRALCLVAVDLVTVYAAPTVDPTRPAFVAAVAGLQQATLMTQQEAAAVLALATEPASAAQLCGWARPVDFADVLRAEGN